MLILSKYSNLNKGNNIINPNRGPKESILIRINKMLSLSTILIFNFLLVRLETKPSLKGEFALRGKNLPLWEQTLFIMR